MPPPRTIAALVLCGLLHALPAGAQPQDASAIFRDGIDAFAAQNYRRALDAFERVFALRGNPDLLFNIYRCHRAMGDAGRAAEALRRFLVARPDRSDRAELEAELSRLDVEARALAAPAPAAPPTPGVGRGLSGATRGVEARQPSGLGPGPWIALGVGVALSGVGAGLMLAAASAQTDAGNATSERNRATSLDGASTQHAVGAAMVGVGGAAILGGVLWRVLTPRAPSLSADIGGDRVVFTVGARWP